MALDIPGLIGGLLGGDSVITQMFVYQGLGQILGPLLTPYGQGLLNRSWTHDPVMPLSPADAALMVLKAILTEDEGAAQAVMSGINADNFHKLVLANGEPPGIEQVLQWARRGLLPYEDKGPGVPSVPEAVRTSRIRPDWLQTILDSQWLPITVGEAVDAWVRNQITPDAAKQYLKFNGIRDPEATILFNTNGRPPAPGQLGELVNRGFIAIDGVGPLATTFKQGISESDIKDKWEPLLEHLIVKLPGIFQIRLMQQQGAISAQQALTLFREEGLPSDIAQSAVTAASNAKTTKTKQLQLSTVEKLYTDQIITRDEAKADLENLGYDQAEAEYILEVHDFAAAEKAISAAVSKIRSQYIARHIDEDAAKQLLTELSLSDAQISGMLSIWTVERSADVKVLTAAEVVSAVKHEIADNDWALQRLTNLGYSPDDAWYYLSIHLGAPQPNPPAAYVPVTPPPATGATG